MTGDRWEVILVTWQRMQVYDVSRGVGWLLAGPRHTGEEEEGGTSHSLGG